jgi:hypothetical protein
MAPAHPFAAAAATSGERHPDRLHPQANADSQDTYAGKLRGMGFDEVRVTSIREHVFPGWHRALAEDPALVRRLPLAGRIPYGLFRNASASSVYSAFDYVIASATKAI